MRAARPVFALLFSAAAASCGDGGPTTSTPAATASLTGVVRDAEDDTPIADASVGVAGQGTTSSSDGRFALSGLPTGETMIQATAPGFALASEALLLQEGENSHDLLLDPNSIYETGDFTMYLPKEVAPVRGVILFLTGIGGDNVRPWIRGEITSPPPVREMREEMLRLVDTYGSAFVGNRYDNRQSPSSILSVLEQLADLADRPTLADAPVVIHGYSAGAVLAARLAFEFPERTLGVYSYKADVAGSSDWTDLASVPFMFHRGELDEVVGSTIPTFFAEGRQEGAPWAAGIEPGVGHGWTAAGFISAWLEHVLVARLPNEVVPGTLPTLEPVAEESGWLGSHDTFDVMPFADFSGDPGSASWFADESTARSWQGLFGR